MLNYMAQYNPLDPTSLPINAGKDFLSLMEKPIKDWKIALTLDYDLFPTDTEIKNMVHDAAMRLTVSGAKVELVPFCFHYSLEDFAKTWCQSISIDTACNPVLNQNNGNTRGPKEINGVAVEPVIGFTETFLVNFVGYPAASVPIGLNTSGLPVGMQIIGKQYRDEDVLAVAHKFEAIQPWSYDIPFSRM